METCLSALLYKGKTPSVRFADSSPRGALDMCIIESLPWGRWRAAPVGVVAIAPIELHGTIPQSRLTPCQPPLHKGANKERI